MRAIREHLGKTQKEMDVLLKIGKGSWQRNESGGYLPGSTVIAALSEFGYDANWLLTGLGSMLGVREDRVSYELLGNDDDNNKLSRLRSASDALMRILDDEEYSPSFQWITTIQELMVLHDLDDEGARLLVQRLKSLAQDNGRSTDS